MALRKTFLLMKEKFLGELRIEDAYWKVVRINGDKNKIDAEVSVVIDGVAIHTAFYKFVPDMGGQNFIAQTHDHLKTLPEFSGATDC